MNAAVLEDVALELSDRPFHPLITEMVSRYAERASAWHVESDHESSQWTRVGRKETSTAAQGWKLHISAGTASAEAVLRRAVPILLAEGAAFKTASSLRALGSLNQGEGGISQIGKFITVYPDDDAQAVRLAVALDEATRGLSGPCVPSDRPLSPGSLVHYRYGGFGDQHVQTALGRILPAISTPDGDLVPDQRLPVFRPPEWAVDPFVAAGVTGDLPPRNPLVAERYLITTTLHTSSRSTICLAVDIATPRCCVLKQARRGTMVGADGLDAIDRLRHEAAILGRLAPDPRFPTVFDLVEHEGEAFLVMEDVEGVTLERHVTALGASCHFLPLSQVVAWGRELAAMLDTIHAHGLLYRDLKSPNLIVTPDHGLRLLDFELAREIGTRGSPFGRGTRGYMSPQQDTCEPGSVTDDVFGLGAILYFMATAAEPSLSPRPFNLLDRSVTLLNPNITPEVAAIIARCLDPDPHCRFQSMSALEAALAACADCARTDVPQVDRPAHDSARSPIGQITVGTPGTYAEQARRLGDTISAVARPAPNAHGLAWVTTHSAGARARSRDLNTGSAGTLLALADIVDQFDVASHRAVLAQAANALAQSGRDKILPGLYVGEAGVGAALLRAGQILDDPGCKEAAAERGRRIAAMDYVCPDLFNGTAGRLRFHLLLWDETGAREHLQAAIEAGESLISAAEKAGDDEVRWTIPPGYDGLSGAANLGYAHGAAGIADALLDLFEVTGDERFLTPALGAARWLSRQAVAVLDDDSGCDWPVTEGAVLPGAFWCHGATGVGQLFLHIAMLSQRCGQLMPEAPALAARAARTVAHGARRAGPTQCHGLAGNIEFLLDMYQATADRLYLDEARSLGELLNAFGVERDGLLMWSSESPSVFTPDYMVGYAGVAACLLRLADPSRRPRQLSRAGFRFRRSTREG
jgi:serine/threonine protein kinase